MGKVDDLRALREANWAARQKPVSKSEERRLSCTPAAGAGAAVEGGSQPAVESTVPLCGHTSIGKKTCIRPKDHPEKNHRYGKATS